MESMNVNNFFEESVLQRGGKKREGAAAGEAESRTGFLNREITLGLYSDENNPEERAKTMVEEREGTMATRCSQAHVRAAATQFQPIAARSLVSLREVSN